MCTDFLIQSGDGAWINGRSMEFGMDLRTKLYVQAPKQRAVLKGVGGDELETTPDYGYVGTSSWDLPVVTDGLNTAGLSTGALWLPGSEYQPPSLSHKNVFCAFFVNWMLGHCATVADVRHALESGSVHVIGSEWVAKAGPLHFPVHDAQGNSLVIEFLDGKPVISNNPVAVLTNRPVFPWQLDNLRNYVNLSPWDKENITLGSLAVTPTGHGSGLDGLPGNATPPSRFVRAAYLKQFALQQKTAEETAVLAFHLLNNVDIPLGTVRAKTQPTLLNPEGVEYDYTQWVVVKDLTHRLLNIRVYGSPLTWNVDLKSLDFAGLNGKQLPIPTGQVALPLLG
ncbi:linear amide C-N hydrolase [Stigmatella aurantiaca]|uniref:Choloylglycine hydrolase family protein n=1 Tax=Stigmatella aurantiaca (strain DW4/3-1) TaxID=378806 RepID=Q09DR6_STIAD|nr:linear amide C-N hydrolase [Stigmatella aurantiaca]ADO75250.1 Choloylglycine hydrolase family protein [Stigmatella aurantiaca DW4/3-1]EAU69884.1 penicillin amidase [Stigmatella aurantiaca DW4/3-1]